MVLVDRVGERTMLHNIGADAAVTAAAIESRLAGPFLHVGGALVLPGLDDPDGAPLAGLFERARASGRHTSLDVVHDSIDPRVSAPARPVARALLPLVGLFVPPLRGIAENMYIGYEPYIVDHSAYAGAFGDHATPLPEAIRATVQWYRAHTAHNQHTPAVQA